VGVTTTLFEGGNGDRNSQGGAIAIRERSHPIGYQRGEIYIHLSLGKRFPDDRGVEDLNNNRKRKKRPENQAYSNIW